MPQYRKSLFIFRRDLRLADNSGLNAALAASEAVLPCFIADPKQIQPHPYQSKPGLQFMLQALADLDNQLAANNSCLLLFEGSPEAVLRQIALEHEIQAVFINRDYTPYSRQRDWQLWTICQELQLALHVLPDYLLNEPEQAVKSDGTPYKVFTAFYQRARQLPVAVPQELAKGHLLKLSSKLSLTQLSAQLAARSTEQFSGGSQQAIMILDNLATYQDYLATHDFPALAATSKLSAHLKFGTCSIRSAYYAIVRQLGSEHPLIRQLYWRDFFTHIAWHFPSVFGHAFLSQYEQVVWDNDTTLFEAWTTGRTGFPIVDAGMRELNATGFMHNRVRMITASFLVKDLHISWRWGERYFAQHLIDYDPCVNNGNWQWAASTGCDAQPYFRIFNPWIQQQKFDPECTYIYQWLPELREVPIKVIHHWDKQNYPGEYPAPIVAHAQAVAITKARYQQAASLNVHGDKT